MSRIGFGAPNRKDYLEGDRVGAWTEAEVAGRDLRSGRSKHCRSCAARKAAYRSGRRFP